VPDDTGGHPGDHRQGLDIPGHDRPGGDHRTPADPDTGEDHGPHADPRVVLDDHRAVLQRESGKVAPVVGGEHHHLR
jgi:hypothetical protein